MDKEVIKNMINELYDNYDLLKNIAIRMDTSNKEIKYENWFHKYPVGMFISELDFDSDYLKNNFQECFIKAKLYDFAIAEDWSLDFFDIPQCERQKLMELEFYKGMFTYQDKRMKIIDYEKFEEDFVWFTSENDMSSIKQKYFLNQFKDAVIIELGGCYSADYECCIVTEDKIFIIDYGIWD